MQVCDVYKLRRVTYYLAIDLVDRYLSRVEGLPKNQLQLLGITCLFIAAKVEETYPPKLAELAYVTDGACTEQDMLLVEISVLRVLKWNVNPLTVTGWLNLYMQICYDSKNSRDCLKYRKMMNDDFIYPQFSAYNFVRASQLTDLCSLDEGMLLFQYSVIAASAMYYIFNRERALYVSGYSWEQIRECVAWMGPFHQVANQQAVSSACEGPKERHRGSGGLKKLNPKILVSEIHCVQTHSVSLKMLEDVYQLNGSESETNLVDTELEDLPSAATPESTEESITDDTSNTNGHRESNSRLTFEIDDTLLDAVEIPFDVKNDENCDLFKDSNDEYNHVSADESHLQQNLIPS